MIKKSYICKRYRKQLQKKCFLCDDVVINIYQTTTKQ